jgi:hypothetical protein
MPRATPVPSIENRFWLATGCFIFDELKSINEQVASYLRSVNAARSAAGAGDVNCVFDQ